MLFLLSGCGASLPVTSNHNVHQTNVVLSQNNYDIVRHVEAEVSATYVFGIGGVSRKALKSNAVAGTYQKIEDKFVDRFLDVEDKNENIDSKIQ